MSITLETVLGNTVSVDPNTITGTNVGNIENHENNLPLITANFVRNVWKDEASDGYGAGESKEISRYVVIKRPENLGQLLLETIAKDGYERASLYVLEIEEWNEKERKKMRNWEEEEQKKREEHEFEQEIAEEEARKDPVELIFDALEHNFGINGVNSLRSQYIQNREQGIKKRLSDLRTRWLMQFLDRAGVSDEYVQKDVKAIIESGKMSDENRTWQILVDTLHIKTPTVEAPEATDPPELELKEVPSLLRELESVALAPYNGQSLEDLKLTQKAWDVAGINPQEVRDKAIKDVISLNDQHLLVRVVGKSEKGSGNLNLLQIISGAPKVIRPYFRKPSEIAYDAYALGGIIFRAINDYFKEDEEGKKIISGIGIEKQPFLKRAIAEKMLNRITPLASVAFPNWHAVVVNDEEPYRSRAFKEDLKRFPLVHSIGQKWYATNVTQAELKQYEDIAAEVIPGIKARFAVNRFSVKRSDGEIKDVYDLTQIIYTVRSLVDSVPSEYFELMEANEYGTLAEHVNGEIARLKRERKVPAPPIELLYAMRSDLGAESERRALTLTKTLGNFLMKGTNEWRWELPGSVVASMIFKYGVGKTVEQPAYQAGPS